MLPNTHDFPSEVAQFAAHLPVAFPVGGNFCIPKFLVTAGTFKALWTTVPKTAVHKNNNPLAPECEIRLAKKRLVAPLAGDGVLAENFNQAQLRCFVAARADQRHHLGPFLF